jgi:hypothetical protein
MFGKVHWAGLLLFGTVLGLCPPAATESWLLGLDDPAYLRAEELFLANRMLPPFEDTPVAAEELRLALEALLDRPAPAQAPGIRALLEELRLPLSPVSPIVRSGLRVYGGSGEELIQTYNPNGDHNIYDYLPFYELHDMPALLTLGFIASAGDISLHFQPELRERVSSFLYEDNYTSIPNGLFSGEVGNIDANQPYRGVISFYKPPLEMRAGREKLQLGPGRISSLGISRSMPYFDQVKFRFFAGRFSYSWYLIRLNPILSDAERAELESINDGSISNPEVNADNQVTYTESAKHLAVHKFLFTPFPWLSLGIAELNMIGGKTPQLADLNPLTLFHSNFDEGTTNQTMSITAQAAPLAGVLLYTEFFLYEKVMSTERQDGYKPTARAFQAGLTALSTPYFSFGPGRLRLDAELAYVDPWCYARWYDLKKYTSRFVYVEPGHGRIWVDYPLGFYLGPDAVQYRARLAYGDPGRWETALSWKTWGKGGVDLYGWGDESDYPNPVTGVETEYLGLTITDAPSPGPDGLPVFWSHELTASLDFVPRVRREGLKALRNLSVSAWGSLKWMRNRYHISGDDRFAWQLGTQCVWSLY